MVWFCFYQPFSICGGRSWADIFDDDEAQGEQLARNPLHHPLIPPTFGRIVRCLSQVPNVGEKKARILAPSCIRGLAPQAPRPSQTIPDPIRSLRLKGGGGAVRGRGGAVRPGP